MRQVRNQQRSDENYPRKRHGESSFDASNSSSLPLQYRFGGAWFCELPFFVDRRVLIPRFDTEKLVEAVVLNMKKNPRRGATPPLEKGEDFEGIRVLELCTGSGCVAVVLARHGFEVTATDISRGALRVARKNAKLHEVDIKFLRGDLFPKGLKSCANDMRKVRLTQDPKPLFDCIVANPPYIRSEEIGKFDRGVLVEPRIALDGGVDGLEFYRRIIERAGEFLVEGGRVFLEMDYRQGGEIGEMLAKAGFCDIKLVRDMQGLERVIWAKKSILRG